MNLLNNRLRGFQSASFGGWGGRSGMDIGPGGPDKNFASARFFGFAQRDLAARFKWAVSPRYVDGNHAPLVVVKGALDRTVLPGETVVLSGSARDPDGDVMEARGWQYIEAGTYPEPIRLLGKDGNAVSVGVPLDATRGQTIHMIYEVTDRGRPALTRYARVILTVK